MSTIDWLILGAYFGFLLLVTFRHRRHGGSDVEFLLSGRRMTLPAFVATLVSTWYGGILGLGEYSYQYGISQWLLFGVPFYLFSAVFAFLLAGRIRENPALTLPEAVEARYGTTAGRLSVFPIFLLVSPAPYILMIGLLFQHLLGGEAPFLLYASLVALFSVLYVSVGGFQAVVRTDALQVVLMFGGFIALMWFAGQAHGGIGVLWNEVPPLHRDPVGGHSAQYVLVWFFIALWTFVDPSFHQRAAAAGSPAVARRGILWSILFWLVLDVLTAFSGLYAFMILGPGLENPVLAYPLLASQVMPAGWLGLFFVALFATIMSTMDSYLFLSGQTLGRDFLLRIFPAANGTLLTRIGIVASAALGIALIVMVPSVVNLWYVIGSVVIPGLLIPVLGIYVEAFRLPPGRVVLVMAGGTAISTAWLLMGVYASDASGSYAFLGVEPFYPGLAFTVPVWLWSMLRPGRQSVEDVRPT